MNVVRPYVQRPEIPSPVRTNFHDSVQDYLPSRLIENVGWLIHGIPFKFQPELIRWYRGGTDSVEMLSVNRTFFITVKPGTVAVESNVVSVWNIR